MYPRVAAHYETRLQKCWLLAARETAAKNIPFFLVQRQWILIAVAVVLTM